MTLVNSKGDEVPFFCDLKPTLQLEHFRIYSSTLHKFRMIPSLDNGSMIEDDDVIGFFDGLETVGDDDDRTTLEEVMESNVDLLFGEAVECTGWFIEDDNLGILDKDFCNS